MACKVFKSGFSLVEVMMFLLVASLIAAASVPIVTKKHFKLPQVVGHGAYLCSYNADGVTLHESRWTGKYVLKKVLDRDVTECKFVVPDKAPYFQISAIGGGGGGGDAGYKNVEPTSGVSAEQKLGPFNLTEDYLNQHGIALSEFNSYKGKLYGYARSGSSGGGGSIGYMVASPHEECSDPEIYDDQECATYTTTGDRVCTETTTSTDSDGNVTTDSVICSHTTTKTAPGKYVYSTVRDGDYKECTEDQCTAWEEVNCVTTPKTKRECTYGTHKEVYYEYASVNGTTGSTGTPSHGDQSTGTRITGGPYYRDVPDTTPTSCTDVPTGEYTTSCDSKCTSTTTITYDCSTYKTEREWVEGESYTDTVVSDTCGSRGGSVSCSTSSGGGECTSYKTVKKYRCNAYTTYYTYSRSSRDGNSGAAGATCVSSDIPGALNLTGEGFSNTYNAKSGSNKDLSNTPPSMCYNSPDSAEQGYAPCVSEAYTCSTSNPATHSSYSFNGTEAVRATSATAGGGGGVRGGCPSYSDESSSSSITAVGGTCTTGSSGTPCGSGNYGYCLKHLGSDTNVEHNGAYRWKYTYDNNYLTYGAAGEPGELKTAIVRSLKGVDTTISLGQGGAAATLDSGGNGGDGSATTFGLNGSIISANGGKGGAGNLQSPIDTFLPAYDPTKHANGELVKKYYGQAGTQANAVGLASKIMNIIVDNNDGSDATNIFMQKGIGGQGGGVQHNCWAGQRVYYFEGQALTAYSVYPSDIPSSCKTDFANISAKKGNPGALLIKW